MSRVTLFGFSDYSVGGVTLIPLCLVDGWKGVGAENLGLGGCDVFHFAFLTISILLIVHCNEGCEINGFRQCVSRAREAASPSWFSLFVGTSCRRFLSVKKLIAIN